MATLQKFGFNEFGIKNASGVEVTGSYLRRYIHCWCRKSDGFTYHRKENIEFFCSAAFINAHPGCTASQLGKIAHDSPRWKAAKKVRKPAEQLAQ